MNLDLFADKVFSMNPFALRNVESIFGADTVKYSKTGFPVAINKQNLGAKVFRDKHKLKVLTSITSPEIKKLMFEHFLAVELAGQHDIIAVEGAILIEANTYKFFDELWVVTLPKDEALKRVLVRDPHLTENQV